MTTKTPTHDAVSDGHTATDEAGEALRKALIELLGLPPTMKVEFAPGCREEFAEMIADLQGDGEEIDWDEVFDPNNVEDIDPVDWDELTDEQRARIQERMRAIGTEDEDDGEE